MVRKTLYALIAISLVLVVNQVRTVNGTAITATTGTVPTVTSTMTGSIEVRLSSTQANSEVTAADITISGVEIQLASGWSKMKLADTKVIDLKQVEGAEQAIATSTGVGPGTYTQVRITIAAVDVTFKGSQPSRARLSSNTLSFTKNFQVTAKNTTVLVINFDLVKSINDIAGNQITFTPAATLLFAPPGAMQLVTASLPQGKLGVAYYAKLMAIGGQQPYTWSITMGDLPAGLNLDPETGVISGTPTVAGDYYFVVRADDSSRARKSTIASVTGGVANPSIPPLNIIITA